ATLENCSLVGASLAGTCLTGVELSGADLSKAKLKQADLSHAELTAAKLTGAELEAAVLSNATLTEANMDGANLTRAVLHDSHLEQISAYKAQFTGASLLRSNLAMARLTGADLSEIDARHASFEEADLTAATLHGARLGKSTLVGIKLTGAAVDSVDLSENGDGSERLLGQRALNFLTTGKIDSDGDGTRYFGRGDVLRDATLEFGANSSIHVDSRFENCTLTLGDGAELVIGESGVLKDCQIQGSGNITIHGRFFERQSPGIIGPRSLVVSARGAMVGAVAQAPEATLFAFEPGCRLRIKIMRAAEPQVLPAAAE
ncbi:MAG TPA: pentapeptide repeat-containing protein, partial [Polyangiaceae bacterium]|nr:pentapeptide repeat-containing protein [Polyangiaceae bacterium]